MLYLEINALNQGFPIMVKEHGVHPNRCHPSLANKPKNTLKLSVKMSVLHHHNKKDSSSNATVFPDSPYRIALLIDKQE